MATSAEPQPFLRFGNFELDLHTRELRSNGKTLNLQEQPFQVLAILLERPGELVTRDELMKRLWPSDTFVDFDHSLNKAVNRLREVLGDPAENPVFVGTVPRRGYRFLAPVHTPEIDAKLHRDPKALPSVLHVVPAPEIRRKPFLLGLGRIVLMAIAVTAAVGAGFLAGKVYWRSSPPSFHRITFRRQYISAARFGGDSKTIVYSAALDRNKPQIFSESSENPESRELGMGIAHLLSISKTGQMAISREPMIFGHPEFYKGTLAQISLFGGAAREVREQVVAADWDPEGKQLAEAIWVKDHCRVEFPAGKILYESKGWVSHMRISPNGKVVAFFDHEVLGDDRGSVVVVNLQARKTILTPVWEAMDGLAWSPSGDEVWFTAAVSGSGSDLYAVTLGGHQRVIDRIGRRMVLQDIAADGRLLLTEEDLRTGISGFAGPAMKENDLGWLDWSNLGAQIPDDGKSILFDEQSESTGPNYAVCWRKLDGSPVVRLGEGQPTALSPDGNWVMSIRADSPGLFLLPTGAGEAKRVESHGIEQRGGTWFPDGRRMLITGNEPGRPIRTFVQSVDGSQFRALTPENVIGYLIAPDGKWVIAQGSDDSRPNDLIFSMYPTAGGTARPVSGIGKRQLPFQWSSDGRTLYVQDIVSTGTIYQVNLSSGVSVPWKTIVPADPAGLLIDRLALTRDGKHIFYEYTRITSELYVIDGLK